MPGHPNIRRVCDRAVAENMQIYPDGDPLASPPWLAQSSYDKSAWYTVTINSEWGEI